MKRIVEQAKAYCEDLLRNSRCSRLPFHNLEHTEEVFTTVEKIGRYENSPIEVLEPVLLGALFHDIGNAEVFTDHEDVSVRLAIEFLLDHKYPNSRISTVVDCINATRMPQKPITLLQRIICDADLNHLGTSEFRFKNKALRREWSLFLNIDYSDKEWMEMNLKFLGEHHYFTTYGKAFLNPVKIENMMALNTQLKALEKV